MEQLELGYEPEQSSVEPEVRACVSSLVSAVSVPFPNLSNHFSDNNSSVVPVQSKMDAMCLVTTP